jgi:hypothetical protein
MDPKTMMPTLDDLIEHIRTVLESRFPLAQYAAFFVHEDGKPDTVISISPRIAN